MYNTKPLKLTNYTTIVSKNGCFKKFPPLVRVGFRHRGDIISSTLRSCKTVIKIELR